MNPQLTQYIEQATAKGVSLYEVRTKLLAIGWSPEIVDAHIQFKKTGEVPAMASSPTAVARPYRMPFWQWLLSTAVVLAVLYGLGASEVFTSLVTGVGYGAWVMWFGGASSMRNLLFPTWDEAGIKLYVGGMAILLTLGRIAMLLFGTP